MFSRRAWQRVGPLAWRSFKQPRGSAPIRHMSSGVPGGSSNMTYVILCGGGLTAAVIYAYKTVNGDTVHYEDRPADVGTSAKTAAPATETIPVEEAAPVVEVITESVFIPVEPVAETGAEFVVETVSEKAADVVSEVLVTEATAGPVAMEEVAPPVAVEVAEAAPVAVETPAEATALESTGAVTDLLTAVKVLSGSTVEIAAASVGEKSLMNAVQQMQEDEKALNSNEEVVKPEILEATVDLLAETIVSGKEAKSAEAGAADELSDEEEVGAEETSAPAVVEEEGAALSSPEQFTSSVQAVVEVVEVAVEDQALNLDSPPKEALFSTEASLEDTSPAKQVTIDDTSGAETSVKAAAEALGKEAIEIASTLSESETGAHMTQLAAASTASELDVLSVAEPESGTSGHEAKHCHSCPSASLAVEEVAPPTDVGEELINEEAMETTQVKEVASLVTKTSGTMMTSQS